MRTNKNKILIKVLIVIAVLAIIGGIFTYLFLCTDVFRSGQELFAKYLMQNIEEVKEVSSIEKINQLEEKLEQSKYEENLEISCLEAGESEPIVQVTADTQKDAVSGKVYSIFGLDFDGAEEKMEIEYMQESDMYSLRFTNVVKQFLTVQNSDLKQLAENLGMDEATIEVIPDTIDFNKFSFEELEFSEEEINVEINKYSSLLYNNIAKEKYQKNKNVVITVNGKTMTTNSYVLTLSAQDIKTLLLKTLEELKKDEIILGKLQKLDEKLVEYDLDSIKESFETSIQEEIDYLKEEEIAEQSNIIITVYEANKETVRVKAEKDLEYLTLDTTRQEANKQIDINYTSMDEENTQFTNKISLVKESENKLNIHFTNVDGEEQYAITLNLEVTENGNSTEINMSIEGETYQFTILRSVKIVDEIDYKVTLDNSNNIVLNNVSSARLASILTALGERVNIEYVEPLEEVIEPILMLIALNQPTGEIEDTDILDLE